MQKPTPISKRSVAPVSSDTVLNDPFYSKSHLAHLRRGITVLDAGGGVAHEPIELPEDRT